MKNNGFYGYIYVFSVDYYAIADDDILNIHKYLIKKHGIKQYLDLLKKYLL